MKTKLMALFLTCFLVFSAVAMTACGGDDTGDTDTTAPVTTEGNGSSNTSGNDTTTADTTTVNKWEDVSFSGTTLRIGMNDYASQKLTTGGSYIPYMQGPDDVSTDAVLTAAYERNEDVYQTLGIETTYLDRTGVGADHLATIQTEIQGSAAGAPDIYVEQNWVLVRGAILGLFCNTLDDTEDNYFDFDNKHWYRDFMEATSLTPNERIYMLAGDYFIENLRYAYTLFANVDIFEEAFPDVGGIQYLFDVIKDGVWDYDTFKTMIGTAHQDNGVLGTQDAEDVYGLTYTSVASRCFLYSADIPLFTYDANGIPSYSTNSKDLSDYVDDVIDILSLNACKAGDQPIGLMTEYLNGNALFTVGQSVMAMEDPNLQNAANKFCIIPMPKYDTSDDYRTLIGDNACSGAISLLTAEFPAATAFLQLQTELSGDFIKQYYDITLKYGLSGVAGSQEVIDYIRDGIISPFEFLYDNMVSRNLGTSDKFPTGYDIVQQCYNSKNNSVTTLWDGCVGAKQAELERLIDMFVALEN